MVQRLLVLLVGLVVLGSGGRAFGQCPAAPAGVGVTTSGCDRVVNWTFSGTNPLLFRVYRGTGTVGQATAVGFVGGASRSYTDVNAPTPPSGTTWRYWVQAVVVATSGCPAGEGPVSAFASTSVVGVAPPSNVQANTGSCREVQITWTSVFGQSVQTIFDTPGGPVIQTTVNDLNATWRYSGSGAVPTRARVSVVGPCGPGVETVVTFTALIDPFEPTSVAATQNQVCASIVSWTPDVRHAGGYRVKRLLNGATTDVVDVPAGTTQYTDLSGDVGVTYEYRVSGINGCGESGYGAAFGRRLPGAPLLPAQSARASIGGTAVLTMPNATLAGPAATFAWRKGVNADGTGGVPLVNGGRIAGADTPTLTIAGVVATDEDLYGLTVGQTCYPQTYVAAVLLQGAASGCRADFDNSGTVTVQDIFTFLSAWFAGCP